MEINIKESEISIDAEGKVIFNNPELKKRVEMLLEAKKENRELGEELSSIVNVINCQGC